MKLKNIVFTFVVPLALVSLFAWNYVQRGGAINSGQSTASQSLLSAPERSYDLGTISMKNGDASKEFRISNPTDKDITLSTVTTSCMCTKAFIVRPDQNVIGPFGMPGMGFVPPANETIKAGDSRTIRVVYDPNAHGPAGVGKIDRFVTLTDSSGGTIQLEIKALVIP